MFTEWQRRGRYRT